MSQRPAKVAGLGLEAAGTAWRNLGWRPADLVCGAGSVTSPWGSQSPHLWIGENGHPPTAACLTDRILWGVSGVMERKVLGKLEGVGVNGILQIPSYPHHWRAGGMEEINSGSYNTLTPAPSTCHFRSLVSIC